jgi:SNF2 family DNA or RNA helicase
MKVDIKVSELLDKLVFSPRKKEDRPLLKTNLIKCNNGIRFTQSAEGLWLQTTDAWKLDTSCLGMDLSWSELAKKVVQNRKHYHGYFPSILKEIKKIRTQGKEVAKSYLNDIKGLTALDDHQWVNVACMTLPNSFGLCVFDEQGAGKTVTFIYAYDVLVERDEVDFALIIAPKSMVSEWPVDFHRFMLDRYKIQTLTGSNTEKKKCLANKADIIITNFETAVSMEDELRSILRKNNSRSIIAVDESFFAKNLDTKRTQAIRRLREYCGRAFVLCGTPAPNAPVDLVQQFNIVDFGFTFGGVSIPKDKTEAATIVRQTIEERGLFVRHLKSDVLPNLPPKKFNRLTIEMQPKQFQLYKNTSDNLIKDLEKINDKTFEENKMSFLAKRSALLQICSNPLSIDKSYNETPAKLLAIDKILEELITRKKEKVILWSFYTASLESMFLRYQHYNTVRYDGTITDTSIRREGVRRFREDKETMLFIGNPAAAGAGLNLQSARYAVYESMSNQAAHTFKALIVFIGEDRKVRLNI